MREVGAFEAKAKLSELLDAVMAGEEIIITRRGKEAARLMPPRGAFDREAARQAAQAIREMSKGVRLNGISIKELIGEGRV